MTFLNVPSVMVVNKREGLQDRLPKIRWWGQGEGAFSLGGGTERARRSRRAWRRDLLTGAALFLFLFLVC